MKAYQVRCTMIDNVWTKIEAEHPDDSACIYADEYGLSEGDLVTVRGVGVYQIYEETVYQALRIKK